MTTPVPRSRPGNSSTYVSVIFEVLASAISVPGIGRRRKRQSGAEQSEEYILVTTLADPTINTRIAVAPKTETPRPLFICPRCDARLRFNYDEPICLQCGYVKYDYAAPDQMQRQTNLMSAGTRSVLRYVGDFPTLAETLTQVKLVRLRNRVVYGVTCPFCGQEMTQSSLSGKRREAREERYKCSDGHRVSLTPGKNGSLGGTERHVRG